VGVVSTQPPPPSYLARLPWKSDSERSISTTLPPVSSPNVCVLGRTFWWYSTFNSNKITAPIQHLLLKYNHRTALFLVIAQRVVVVSYRPFGTTYRSRLQGLRILTLRRLMSYIYMEHSFLMFLDHTQRCSTYIYMTLVA
jgi:hypothetical protein